MNKVFFLSILIYWCPFLSATSLSFDFDKHIFQELHYINQNFSIGATFTIPTSNTCYNNQCFANLVLSLRNTNNLSIDLWCDPPTDFVTHKYDKTEDLLCVLDGINATVGKYRLSAVAQVHTAGSFILVFSVIFHNNSNANQEWSSEKIHVFNSFNDEQPSIKLPMIKRNRRQDINIDDVNIQSFAVQDDSVNQPDLSQIQTLSSNDATNAMNQLIQLNTYVGDSNPGHTADLTCNGANSCSGYPKIDETGQTLCCFLLPQVPDGSTALSSVIYQNGAQNLNDFQVDVGDGKSLDALKDLSVFIGPIIPLTQCNIILPVETTQPNNAQFRVTWTYQFKSADNYALPPTTTTMTDEALLVNVLRVTRSSAFVQQTSQYNEWFVCPPTQDGQASFLRTIALLAGDNVNYFRCIYVNNQGIPLKNPTNGQLLVLASSKDDGSDDPSITVLPPIHTDCLSIQFFPNDTTPINPDSILISIEIAFQPTSTADMSAVMPQVSDLQGTSEIDIDLTIDISPITDDNADNTRQGYDQNNSQPAILPVSDTGPMAVQPVQSSSNVSPETISDCQERTSSTYGTYPPDLFASTIPTKKPSKIFYKNPTNGLGTSVTPPKPYPSFTVQTLADHTCFDQMSFSNNPFLYDLLISTSDYTNAVDCLSPTSGCSIDFSNTKQPKITLLFNTPACISYLRIPAPSNVQQFSYSMFDENAIQIQLPGATNNQGTLLSSSGTDPMIQLKQYSCGYSIILQILTTSDNGPPTKVTVDTGGCFRNLSILTTTTTIAPMLPSMSLDNVSPGRFQQMPSFVPAPSNVPPAGPVPPSSPSAQLPMSPPSVPAQTQYSQYPSPALPSSATQITAPIVSSMSPYVPFQTMLPSPVLMPPPPPPFQTMLSSPMLSSSPPVSPSMVTTAIPSAPSSFYAMIPSPIIPSPPLILVSISISMIPSPVLSAPTPPAVSQLILPSPILPSPISLSVSITLISSPVLQMPTPPNPVQTMIPSPVLLPSPAPSPIQTILPSPIVSSPSLLLTVQSPPQYPPPSMSVIYPSPIYPVPTVPSTQPSQFQVAPDTQSLAPMVCTNNGQLVQLTLGSSCVSQIFTNDSDVVVDYNINPGGQGINFQSNVPVVITVQFNCAIQMIYMCIVGSNTNVAVFSYTLQNLYNDPVASGSIVAYGSNQCLPRPLTITNSATQLIITIPQTTDGQPPRNIVLDLQGCYMSTIPSIPAQPPSVAAVTPSTAPVFWPAPAQPTSQFMAPAPPPRRPQPSVSLATPSMPVPIQTIPFSPSIPFASFDQTTVQPAVNSVELSMASGNMCPQVSLTTHPGVQLIVFSDGTNVTSDFDPDGNGGNLRSTGSTMTVLLRPGMSATFSSVGISSPNVNQIDVAVFEEGSNRPLIQSAQGTIRSPLMLNPNVQNLPLNAAATLAITFLSTIDGQPPQNVKLIIYACFPTTNIISSPPLPTNLSPSPPVQYPSQSQSPYAKPINVCIDSFQPVQVTSVINTSLPPEYVSSNQCVCICQTGIVMPTSSGVLQYYPPSFRTMNKRAVADENSPSHRRKRHSILITKK